MKQATLKISALFIFMFIAIPMLVSLDQEGRSQGIFDPGAGAVDSTTIVGTITVGQGGTGTTSLTSGGILLGKGTLPTTTVLGVADQVLRVPGGGGDPSFGQIDLSKSATVTGVLSNANTSATTTNTANTIVLRDASGNFSAGTITASLSGNASTATDLSTTLSVGKGGTGTTTLTDGGILLGSGTGSVTALGVAANGQIPIGDGTTDPVLSTITGTTNRVTVTNGAGSITLTGPQDIHSGASPTFVDTTLTGTWQVGDPGTKPTCDSSQRGKLWADFGGVGVKDTVEICQKDGADLYAWRTIY